MSKQIFSYTNHSRMGSPEIFLSGKNDIVETEGGVYRDLTSGLWNVNFGYQNPAFTDVFSNQLSKIQFYPNHFWSTTEVAEEASTAICSYFSMGGVYFSTGGSDAVRTSIFISRFCRPNKKDILSLPGSYHGVGNDIMSCTNILNDINENTAAVIIEPIMTSAGVEKIDPLLLHEIDELRNKLGFLIIFDNTVTGFGRADIPSVINPDIIVVSKGLTNGLFPLGATLVSDDIMQYIKTSNKIFDYGITMAAHPIGCALMLKTLELLKEHMPQLTNLRRSFLNLTSGLKIREQGLLFGIEVADAVEARKQLKKIGYLVRDANNVLIVAPMFIVNWNDYQDFFQYLHSIA